MTTADKLLRIDAGTFEVLACAYLRKINPELSQLIQTGLNEKGKTIKDPVDAFLKTTINGKLTFILFEFTTQEIKNLEKKWLKDTSTLKRKTKKSIDGDIIKASKKAEKLRLSFPDAIFQIVICTNQKVSSSLLEKVYIACDKLNLKNEGVIEFSQLHSFLENEPYGQWIRQKYLGISADYLSPELLMWIGKENLESYGEEIFFSSNKSIIKRNVEEELEVLSKQNSLIFLSAESGYGKSILSYKLLESQLEKENFILRLNPTIVSQSSTLEHAVISQLKTCVPNLFTSHLSSIFEIVKEKKMYIVIDDVNKVNNPKEILMKIASWSNKNKKSISQNTPTPYSIICPIWSKYSQFLHTQFQNKEGVLYEIVELGKYSEGEAYNYIRTYFSHVNSDNVTDVQVKEFSKSLEFDPFLISRFCEYTTYIGKLQLSNKSQIIEKFVETKIEERYSDKFLKVEVWKALKCLAFQMLKNKNLQPSFTNLTTWLGANDKELKVIKDLAKDGVLIRFSNQDNLLFRHDRIRDIILILKIEELFQDASWNEDVLLDPYYSELVGQSICRQKQSKEKLELIASRIPIALFESLKYLDTCEKPYQDLIVEIITSWVKEFVVTKKISKEIMDDIYWHLSSIDSKYLVQVTEEMPKYSRSINIAQFRNGNVLALAIYLTSMSRGFGGFAFTVGNPYLRNIITHSKKHFDSKLKQDLNAYLQQDIQDKWREHLIQAAGMLEYTEYYNSIFKCWNNSKDKVKLLAPSIWALLHCFNENDENEKGHLDTIINYWLENTEFYERDGEKIYGTDLVAQNVKRNCKNFSLSAIKKIESWIEKGFLEQCLALDLLTKLDIPWIVEKYFSNSSYWLSVRSNNFSGDELNFIKSKKIFFDIYKNKGLDENLRKDALKCWITNVNERDLPEIRKLPKYSGSLYSTILFRRLALKDCTVSHEVKPQLKELLKESPFWIGILPKIWDNDVKDELLRYLDSKREILEILKICYFIPTNDALEILNRCWVIFNEKVDENFGILNDYLENYIENQGSTNQKLSDKNITFIGSKLITVSLINQNESLLNNIKFLCKKFNKPKPFFKYFSLDYFSVEEPTGWGAYKFHDRNDLGLSEFEILTPFLNYMPYSCLSRIINKASELGFFDWAKENTCHLINHLPAEAEYSQFFLSSEFRSSYDDKQLSSLHFPADIDIMDECHHFINQNEKSYLVSDRWLKRLEKRGCSKERLFNILRNTLNESPNIDVFRFYCDCLIEFGTRSDLKNLKTIDSKIDEAITLPLLKATEYLVKRKRLN